MRPQHEGPQPECDEEEAKHELVNHDGPVEQTLIGHPHQEAADFIYHHTGEGTLTP